MVEQKRNSGAAHFLGVGHGRALSPLLQNHISGSDHSAARWHGTLYPAAEVVTWICDLDVERPADVAARLHGGSL